MTEERVAQCHEAQCREELNAASCRVDGGVTGFGSLAERVCQTFRVPREYRARLMSTGFG